MKKEISELQIRHAKERERYLDRSITQSYEENDTRKLTRLVCNYEEESPKDSNDSIGCVKDADGIMRTNDDSIRNAFHAHWKKMFDHEQDAQDVKNFIIDREEMEDDSLIYNKLISRDEVELSLKRMKSGKAFGLDNLPREFLRYKKVHLLYQRPWHMYSTKLCRAAFFPRH